MSAEHPEWWRGDLLQHPSFKLQPDGALEIDLSEGTKLVLMSEGPRMARIAIEIYTENNVEQVSMTDLQFVASFAATEQLSREDLDDMIGSIPGFARQLDADVVIEGTAIRKGLFLTLPGPAPRVRWHTKECVHLCLTKDLRIALQQWWESLR